jgi:hypothetical protein
VELTEVRTGGQHWWTLGFEATGPAHLLHSALEATAALVFAQALLVVEPGPDQSRSYAEWLGQRPALLLATPRRPNGERQRRRYRRRSHRGWLALRVHGRSQAWSVS